MKTKVPFLDLQASYEELKQEIRSAIDGVCDSQRFILGPEVAALEAEIAEFSSCRHGIGMSSGTDALLAALMAVGVGPGDEVVTTPFTFFATAGVIARLGARPVFADIDPVTYNMDPEKALACVTDRTKAVVPVHLYGRCADLEPLLPLRDRGIFLIEDAAQAIGATDDQGRLAGSIGDMGCFSFFPSKNLGAFGDGGMVVTSEDGLRESLYTLRVHGAKPKYYHHLVGGNFRLDALQAAVLRVKLQHLAGWTRRRRLNADMYRETVRELGLAEIVKLPSDIPGHIYNQFVLRVPERDALRDALSAAGIGTEIYYPLPLHLQECFRGLGYAPGDLPEAEAAASEVLALPIYPELSSVQQRLVVEEMANFYAVHPE